MKRSNVWHWQAAQQESIDKHERERQLELERNGPPARRHCAFQSAGNDFVFVSSILRTKQDVDWQIKALSNMREFLPEEDPAQVDSTESKP